MEVALAVPQGSSPQVRGTRTLSPQRPAWRGLIPAGAGNTHANKHAKLPNWAHPRRCGEHHVAVKLALADRGSSPQVRGTPGAGQQRSQLGGLIPAGAGNTATRPC